MRELAAKIEPALHAQNPLSPRARVCIQISSSRGAGYTRENYAITLRGTLFTGVQALCSSPVRARARITKNHKVQCAQRVFRWKMALAYIYLGPRPAAYVLAGIYLCILRLEAKRLRCAANGVKAQRVPGPVCLCWWMDFGRTVRGKRL